MPAFILIGMGGGLAAATLFASAAMGDGFGRILLYLLAPLPALLAGLGWGSGAAGVAATAGTAGVGLALGTKGALVFFISQGAPLALICHLALLSRPATADTASSHGPIALEWYPIGRLIAVAALIAGALAALSLLVLAPDLDSLRQLLRELIGQVFLKELPGLQGRQLAPEDISWITEFSLHLLPAASAMMWLGAFLLNFWLAGRITLASGRLMRPWPDLAFVALPRGFAFGLAGALALVLVSGYPGLLGSSFAGALFLAYLLVGLAIIHCVTRGLASRPFILWGVYFALFALNTWAALIVALVALIEPLLPFNRFRSPGQGAPE